MKSSRQTTLRSHVTVTGIGVHSGVAATVTIGPADINAGFVFIRTGDDREIVASTSSVVATDFATVLGDHEGPLVSTAEHVLAALRGMGVDNATIEVDGPEIPIMDGSAAPFVDAIDQAGLVQQNAPRRFIEILKPIQITLGDRSVSFALTQAVSAPNSKSNSPTRRSAVKLTPSISMPTASAATSAARAPSAAWAMSTSSGAQATRSALLSKIPWWSMRPAYSTPRACATPMSAFATRFSMWWAIWRSPGCR
jgi:hypothetical protein